MNLLQSIIPVPIPVDTNGSSVRWTETDTKITLAVIIVTFILFLLSIIIEKIRGNTWKDIFEIETLKLTIFSWCIIIFSYTVFSISIFGFLCYFIYSLL